MIYGKNKVLKYTNKKPTRKDRSPEKVNLKYGWREKRGLKKESNERVRRYKGDLQGSDYKKVFDLWWTLF